MEGLEQSDELDMEDNSSYACAAAGGVADSIEYTYACIGKHEWCISMIGQCIHLIGAIILFICYFHYQHTIIVNG